MPGIKLIHVSPSLVVPIMVTYSSCAKNKPQGTHHPAAIKYSYHKHSYMLDGKKIPLLWRHNGRDSVSNHQPHDCLLNRLLRRRSKKTSKLRVTGLRAGNSQGTGEFPAQMASNAENASIWWRHHVKILLIWRQRSWLTIVWSNGFWAVGARSIHERMFTYRHLD